MEEEKKEVEVPAKFKALVEEVEKMSVLDLSELVKVLEDKFGVSAAAPMAMMAAPAAGGVALRRHLHRLPDSVPRLPLRRQAGSH